MMTKGGGVITIILDMFAIINESEIIKEDEMVREFISEFSREGDFEFMFFGVRR